MAGDQSECGIATNPNDGSQSYIVCNNEATPGLFAAATTDSGRTWGVKAIADGSDTVPKASWDPSVAWDTFGNLYVAYVDETQQYIVIILSADGGSHFEELAKFGRASVDRPTIVAADTSAPGVPVAVWVLWNEGGMVARGAAVHGLGVGRIGGFTSKLGIPGSMDCSYASLAVAADGAVAQVCESTDTRQGPSTLNVSIKPDGLGPGSFSTATTIATTNVGPLDSITPQPARLVDAEPGLAYDRNPSSPHFGRLYLIYTDELPDESNDTDIMAMCLERNGSSWSAPSRVNDDNGNRSQFLPRVVTSADTGDVLVCWLDCRNSPTNTAVQEFCAIATPSAFPRFSANVSVAHGASMSPGGRDFGDYEGLAFVKGYAHPVWPDTSNSTGDNPDGAAGADVYTDLVTAARASIGGVSHIHAVDDSHDQLALAGDFVALRRPGALEVQVRQKALRLSGASAASVPRSAATYTSAVALRVGEHRITLQEAGDHEGPDARRSLQLRVDGRFNSSSFVELGNGGSIARCGTGGVAIQAIDRSTVILTPVYLGSQRHWSIKVEALASDEIVGLLGAAVAPAREPQSMPHRPVQGGAASRVGGNRSSHDTIETWRVSKLDSLFDSADRESPASFTSRRSAAGVGCCGPVAASAGTSKNPKRLLSACGALADYNDRSDCMSDVAVTADFAFARLQWLGERHRLGITVTSVAVDPHTAAGKQMALTANVMSRFGGGAKPKGAVQFLIDGVKVGKPVRIGGGGRANAVIGVGSLMPGEHRIVALFEPAKGSASFPSSASANFQSPIDTISNR